MDIAVQYIDDIGDDRYYGFQVIASLLSPITQRLNFGAQYPNGKRWSRFQVSEDFTMRQVIYFSRAIEAVSDRQLGNLLENCRNDNRRDNITGLLLYVGGYFVQVIEGSFEHIGKLKSKIEADKRHSQFALLLDHKVDDRSFAEWNMGFKAISPEDFRDVEAFRFLYDADDISRIEHRGYAVISYMRSFYMEYANSTNDENAPSPEAEVEPPLPSVLVSG